MMKKLISVLLTVLMTAGVVSVGVVPAGASAHTWVGRYSYGRSVYSPDPQYHASMHCAIVIAASEDGYVASLEGYRFQQGVHTELRLRADVQESENQIELVFVEHLLDGSGDFEPGDVLLTFMIEDGVLLTQWGALRPVIGGSHFRLVTISEPPLTDCCLPPWPHRLLNWLQFTLRYFFFGWLWFRWV